MEMGKREDVPHFEIQNTMGQHAGPPFQWLYQVGYLEGWSIKASTKNHVHSGQFMSTGVW